MATQPGPESPSELLLNPWNLPFLAWESWLVEWQHMIAPGHAAFRSHAHHEPEHQLEVPQPIEDDGEHALFA